MHQRVDDPTNAAEDDDDEVSRLTNPYHDLIGTAIHNDYIEALRARGLAHLEEMGIDLDAGPDYSADDEADIAQAVVDLSGGKKTLSILPPSPTKLFVYGTLKSGFHRHEALANSILVAQDCELPAYAMRSEGGYYPAIFRAWNFFVKGELYTVSAEVLEACDQIESVKTGLFRRVREWITCGAKRFEAWVYTQDYPLGDFHRVMHGIWLGRSATPTVEVKGAGNGFGRQYIQHAPDPPPRPPIATHFKPDPYWDMKEKARKRAIHVHEVIAWPLSEEDTAPLRKGNG